MKEEDKINYINRTGFRVGWREKDGSNGLLVEMNWLAVLSVFIVAACCL